MKIGTALLPAICVIGRCLHARCGADGVYGQGRRSTCRLKRPRSPAGIVRLHVQLREG